MTDDAEWEDWKQRMADKDWRCEAITRAGTPCKRRDLYANGRCRLHGGQSTGPKTPRGKMRSAANGIKGGRPRKQSP